MKSWPDMGYLLVAALLVFAEQLLKKALRRRTEKKEFCGGHIRIAPTQNHGIIFGFLKESSRVPAVIQTGALILFSVFAVPALFLPKTRALGKCGIALMLAGACGNVLDRLIHGSVLDYIQFPKLKKLGKLVFDLADFFLLIGSVIFLISSFLKSRNGDL